MKNLPENLRFYNFLKDNALEVVAAAQKLNFLDLKKDEKLIEANANLDVCEKLLSQKLKEVY